MGMKEQTEIKNIIRDLGAALSLHGGCCMTDRHDTKEAQQMIKDGLMWEGNTGDELASLDRLVVLLKRIGIDL